MARHNSMGAGVDSKKDSDFTRSHVIPVTEEVPVISKRRVETGRVRVERKVSEREVVVDEALLRHEVRIERVSIGRDVPAGEQLPQMRYEGDTLIVPVLEEVPVMVKKVVLTEEVRITRVRQEFRDPQTVNIKVEEVSVRRLDDAPADTPTDDDESAST
jgi:stress response protein YsnF